MGTKRTSKAKANATPKRKVNCTASTWLAIDPAHVLREIKRIGKLRSTPKEFKDLAERVIAGSKDKSVGTLKAIDREDLYVRCPCCDGGKSLKSKRGESALFVVSHHVRRTRRPEFTGAKKSGKPFHLELKGETFDASTWKLGDTVAKRQAFATSKKALPKALKFDLVYYGEASLESVTSYAEMARSSDYKREHSRPIGNVSTWERPKPEKAKKATTSTKRTSTRKGASSASKATKAKASTTKPRTTTTRKKRTQTPTTRKATTTRKASPKK